MSLTRGVVYSCNKDQSTRSVKIHYIINMDRILQTLNKVFQAVVVLPLTAGNVSYSIDNKERHDGRISTMAIVCCIVAIILVMIVVHVTQQNTENMKIPSIAISILLASLVVIGLSSMLIVFILAFLCNSDIVLRGNSDQKIPGLKLKFLWFFGFVCVMYNCFLIGLSAYCLAKNLQSNFHYEGYIFYNTILIVFYFTQMVFLSYFSKSKFAGTVSGHYFILFILAANIAIWFESFFNKSSAHFKHLDSNNTVANNTFQLCDALFPSNSSVPSESRSPFIQFVCRFEPFLYPGIVAYSLVAVSFVMNMWVSINTTEERNTLTAIDQEETRLLDDETTPLNASDSFGNISVRRSPAGQTISYSVSLVVGSLVTMPLLVGSIVLVFVNDENHQIYQVYEIYKFHYKILLLSLNMIAFYKLSKECIPINGSKSLTGNEWILLICTYVDTVFHMFELLAGGLTERHVNSQLVFIEGFFNLMLDYFQTVFILQAHRYNKKQSSYSRWPIEHVCLFLFFTNFGRWIEGSFCDVRYNAMTVVQNDFYGQNYWGNVMHIVFPVVIFYRFQCAMDQYTIYYLFKT